MSFHGGAGEDTERWVGACVRALRVGTRDDGVVVIVVCSCENPGGVSWGNFPFWMSSEKQQLTDW